MRELRPLPVPKGVRALEVVPALEQALTGRGPALLPVAEGHDRNTEALGDEDDPADPIALVLATSGSTGEPKEVLLSSAALRASAEATHERLGGRGNWLLAMPAHHIAGIQVLVRALLAGTTPKAVPNADGFRPRAFVEAARSALRAPGRHYTALVPTQLSRLLSDEQGHQVLREFDAVLIGGAATPPALLHRASAAGIPVVTTYGMSETAGGCVYDGVPLRGADVQLDHVGVISLTGSMLSRGYRHGAASAFAGGWFRTGDLGRWVEDRLEVIGRADDVIVTGGVNIAPLPVERILAEQDGVLDACVVGIEDPEWGQAVVAAVVTGPRTPSEDDLRTAVRSREGPAATPKRIVFVPELPLRGPGKPDRAALRTALSDL